MNIKKTIKKHGYTLQQVAEAIGVSRASISKSVHNNPTVQTLRSIAEAIGCDVADFFEDEEWECPLVCPECGAHLIVELKEAKK